MSALAPIHDELPGWSFAVKGARTGKPKVSLYRPTERGYKLTTTATAVTLSLAVRRAVDRAKLRFPPAPTLPCEEE